jgi:hypothetical protein
VGAGGSPGSYLDAVTVLSFAPARSGSQGLGGPLVGEVVGYLAKAETTGLHHDYPGTLGRHNAPGRGGLGPRGTLASGAAARGACALNP